MIAVKSFYIYNDSLVKFDEQMEKYLAENNVKKDDIIAVLPVYSKDFLGSFFTSGIILVYSKK
ncbi:MAG: hypothetical protein ACM3UU_02770 [Ignavibacteriales bacterium]